MELVDSKLKISDIALDPINPRNPNAAYKSQPEIIQDTLSRKDAKELLRSMQECIRWVNKIVVISKEEHKTLHPELRDYDYNGASFVVVEGNTRLSCLKSGKIQGLNLDKEIPVLEAERSVSESDESFKEAILITQGIANVMVVKEWAPHAKAKHIYDMFLLKKKFGAIRVKAIKVISGELGISQNEVRNSIKRYAIYEKIANDAEVLKDDHWGYLEAFDTNQETRDFIGLDDELDWDDEKSDEVISLIPELIGTAISQGISTKKFRDIFRKYTQECKVNDEVHEDSVNKLREVVDADEEQGFHNLIEDGNPDDDVEVKWDEYFDSVESHLKTFPALADWAINKTESLSKIINQLEKLKRVTEANAD